MKRALLIGLLFAPLQAQISDPSTPAPAAPLAAAPSPAPVLRNAADLEKLLGPIALYPDALIGLILPAATTPADIVLAARSLGPNTTAASVATQPWDDSVKGLVHYPDLLRWLDQNLPWTQAIGEAFASQPADVMNAVQRLRQQARAAGTLVDTPQQQVVTQENTLVIVPAQPDVIYVPVYDPAVVYISSPVLVHHRRIHFYSAYRTGPWLCYTPNWHHGYLHVSYHRHYIPSHHVHHYHSHSPYPSHVWSPRPARPQPYHNGHSYSEARVDRRPSSSAPKPDYLNPRPSTRSPLTSDRSYVKAPSSPFYSPRDRAPRQERRENILPSRQEPPASASPFYTEPSKSKRR